MHDWNLTWDEFKELVDKELDKLEIGHDVEIWYIDISFPSKFDDPDRPEVFIDEKLGMSIQ